MEDKNYIETAVEQLRPLLLDQDTDGAVELFRKKLLESYKNGIARGRREALRKDEKDTTEEK